MATKRNSKSNYLFVLLLVLILLTSCSHEKERSNDEIISHPSEHVSEEDDFVDNSNQLTPEQTENWQKIFSYGSFLGKSFYDISKECDGFDYYWLSEGKQTFKFMDGTYCFFESNAWNDTICLAVLLNGSFVSIDFNDLSEKDVLNIYGDYTSMKEEKVSLNTIYEYDFNDYQVEFHFNEEGLIEQDDYGVMISVGDSFNRDDVLATCNLECFPIQPKERSAAKWEIINEAKQMLGNPINKTDSDVWILHKGEDYYGGDYYQNDLSGTRIRIDQVTNLCTGVLIPNNKVFDKINSGYTMKDFVDFWKTSFSWGTYEESLYEIIFDDIVIKIPSDNIGNISNDGYVIIEENNY